MQVFKRESLAIELSTKILTATSASSMSSGLFLAAPRRTGKSTFLREDLVPDIRRGGAIVLYTDLWEDRCADPGMVIIEAIRAELWKHEGVIRRLARTSGLEKADVCGLSFVLARVGLGTGISLASAFEALAEETRQLVVLVIDEAQHASTSELGNNTLFALKAARDRLNMGPFKGLRIVATGSHRDKLAMLRNSRDQAFFCAPLMDFPTLGMDFVRWFCDRQTFSEPLDPDFIFELFRRGGFRPQILDAAAQAVPFDISGEDVNVRFATAVNAQIAENRAGQLRVVETLTPLESTVLRVASARAHKFSPFWPDTMRAYREVMSKLAPDDDTPIDNVSIELALESLCDKSLLWCSTHGVYALEETGLDGLLKLSGMLDVVPAIS